MALIDAPYLFVRWTDAVTGHGWVDEDDDTTKVEVIWSAGWLLHRDRREVRLASDVGETDATGRNRRIAIPMAMVEEIRQDNRTGPVLYEKRRRKRGEEAARVV